MTELVFDPHLKQIRVVVKNLTIQKKKNIYIYIMSPYSHHKIQAVLKSISYNYTVE